MVERDFYNERVARPGDVKIDTDVLGHTIGDIASYPTREEKDDILEQFEGENFWEGLESPLITISAGTGSVETAVSFESAESEGYAMSVGTSLEVETTVGGVMRGYEVGVEQGVSFQYSKGHATEYSGTIGQIDPEIFEPQDSYSVGIFTYVQTDEATGQQFEVINYWVE